MVEHWLGGIQCMHGYAHAVIVILDDLVGVN